MKILESIHSTLVLILDELKAIKEQEANLKVSLSADKLNISKKELEESLSKIKHSSRRYEV